MIKINTSGDYVQLIYVDPVQESVQQELRSDTDAFECSYDSDGKLFMQFGAMRFENPDPTDFTINGSPVTDAPDFISKLNALFTGGGGGGGWGTTGTVATLTGDSEVALNGHQFSIQGDSNSGNPGFFIRSDNKNSHLGANHGDGNLSDCDFNCDTDGDEIDFVLFSQKVGNSMIQIHGNGSNETLTVDTGIAFQVNSKNFPGGVMNLADGGNSDLHARIGDCDGDGNGTVLLVDDAAQQITLNKAILFPDAIALDFSDDAAAAIGGVAVGQLYHNSGAVRIRRS